MTCLQAESVTSEVVELNGSREKENQLLELLLKKNFRNKRNKLQLWLRINLLKQRNQSLNLQLMMR